MVSFQEDRQLVNCIWRINAINVCICIDWGSKVDIEKYIIKFFPSLISASLRKSLKSNISQVLVTFLFWFSNVWHVWFWKARLGGNLAKHGLFNCSIILLYTMRIRLFICIKMQPGKCNTVWKLWAVCAGRSARLSLLWLCPFLKCLLERHEAVWGPAATLSGRVIGSPLTRHVRYPAASVQFVFSHWWKSLFCFTEMDILALLWEDLCCWWVQTCPMFYLTREVKIQVYMNFCFIFQNRSDVVYGVIFVVTCFYVVEQQILTEHMPCEQGCTK